MLFACLNVPFAVLAQTDPVPPAVGEPPQEAAPNPPPSPPDPQPPEYSTTVTATRGRAIGASPVASSVIPSHEIAASPTRSTDDVLRIAPGVALPRSDSRALHPTAQSVALRGIGRGRTLVLLDGAPLNDPFGGWIQWNKVARSQVERIEVVRGATSSLYGSLAMGGVIQLFTRPVTERRLLLEADYGDRDSPHLAAFAATPLGGGFGISGSVDVYRTDGYVQVAPAMRGPVDVASSYQSQNALLRATWEAGPWTSFASLNYFREERSSGTELTQNRQWIADASVGTGADLGPGRLELLATLGQQRFRNANSRVDATRQNEVQALLQTIPVSHAGGSAVWSQAIGVRQQLTAGVDLRWVQASNLEQVFSSQGLSTGSRSASGNQLVGGVFGEWSLRALEWLTAGAGLRADGWSNYGGQQVSLSGETAALPPKKDGALSPRLTAIARLGDGLAVRGAGYAGFRAPNLNELYRGFFSGQVMVIPNPDLGPERLLGVELGLDWSPVPRARLSLTAYADRTTDRIESVTLDATTRQRRNVARADSTGAELEASWRPITPLRLQLSYALTSARIARFPESPALEGKALAGVPLHSGAATVRWSSPEWAEVTFRVRAESAQFADERNENALPAFAVVDLSLSKPLRDEVELFASVSNLFDHPVITDRGQGIDRVGAPRSVWAGFRVRY